MKAFRILSCRTRQRRHRLSAQTRVTLNSCSDPQAVQLAKLNEVWVRAVKEVPYCQGLVQAGLPRQFSSLEAFVEAVPVFGKKDLQTQGIHAFAPLTEGRYSWSSTGGSTAEPVKFPRFSSEVALHEATEWYLRSLVGITPDDPYFRLWGHSHTLGKGPKRLVRILQRKLKDAALGMVRISAYDLSSAAVKRGLKALRGSRSRYVLGYSKALEVYAEALLQDTSLSAHLPALKGVIATAEGFTSAATRERVEAAFRCPVYMEYGSMETGPIAQEMKSGGYQVAWNQYLLEAVPTEEGEHKLLVTALYPRAFPLFRYDLGDLVSGFDKAIGFTRFEKIVGRSYPLFNAPSGAKIHSGPIAHCLRSSGNIVSFQVGLSGNKIVAIFLTLRVGELSSAELEDIKMRLDQVDKGLGKVLIKTVAEPLTTPAGKRPTFIQL